MFNEHSDSVEFAGSEENNKNKNLKENEEDSIRQIEVVTEEEFVFQTESEKHNVEKDSSAQVELEKLFDDVFDVYSSDENIEFVKELSDKCGKANRHDKHAQTIIQTQSRDDLGTTSSHTNKSLQELKGKDNIYCTSEGVSANNNTVSDSWEVNKSSASPEELDVKINVVGQSRIKFNVDYEICNNNSSVEKFNNSSIFLENPIERNSSVKPNDSDLNSVNVSLPECLELNPITELNNEQNDLEKEDGSQSHTRSQNISNNYDRSDQDVLELGVVTISVLDTASEDYSNENSTQPHFKNLKTVDESASQDILVTAHDIGTNKDILLKSDVDGITAAVDKPEKEQNSKPENTWFEKEIEDPFERY